MPIYAMVVAAVVMFATVAQAQTNPKHFFWAPGQPNTPNPSSLANDLIYHGGNAGAGAIGVENKPATYLISSASIVEQSGAKRGRLLRTDEVTITYSGMCEQPRRGFE